MEESESQPDLNFFTPSSSPTAAGDAALPPPSSADGPILICSLPDTPDAGADLGFRLVRRDKAKAKSPPPQAPAEPFPPPPNAGGRAFKKKKRKSRASRNPRGLHISGGTPSPPPPPKPHQDKEATKSIADLDKFRYHSLDALKAAVSSRKTGDSRHGGTSSAAAPTQKPGFRASLEDVVDRFSGAPSPPKVGDSGGTSSAAAATGGKALFPASLEDVVNHFSGEPDMRFADMDILEIAAMKGIHFPQPSWWRPGGYDAKPKKK